MPVRLFRKTSCRRVGVALACIVAVGALLGGCQPEPASVPAAPVGGAARPGQVPLLLAGHLRDNDLEGYVRTAVPPALVPELEAAWRDGGSRWPLTGLPLDKHLPDLLAALAEDGSEARLQATFERQFAGAQGDLRTAALALGQFGVQYMTSEGDYSDHQREHYLQLIQVLSQWAANAPLADSARARQAIARLASAARNTGLASDQDFADAGMLASLQRLAPLLAAAKLSLAAYGLDIDHALAGVRAGLIQQTGDTALVRVRYRLAGQEIDIIMAVERRDGRWYPGTVLAHAETALATAAARARTAPDPASDARAATAPAATP